MRTRLLALLAAGSLVAVGLTTASPAAAKPSFGTNWGICASPTEAYCIESATANGANTVPASNGTAGRDFPFVFQVGDDLIDFGVYHDLDGSGSTTQSVDPSVTYRLVVRTGTVVPREMNAIGRNGTYAISRDTSGYKFTVEFQPTASHQIDFPAPCSVDGGCGDSTTAASSDLAGRAIGDVQTLNPAVSGLSAREVAQRTGMYTFTSAQDHYLFYNIDLGVLEVRMANPHLTHAGVPVTDGTYDAFIPNAWLSGTVGVPDPTLLPGFTLAVSGSAAPASSSFTHVPGGIRIHFAGISFSRPTYRLTPRATPPGKPRLAKVTKVGRHSARTKFYAPLANGRARVDKYQARCHKVGKAWHYRTGKGSPLTVSALPTGKAYCQVRAHNAKGWGAFSAAVRS